MAAMASYAPDGRLLSPGEVYQAPDAPAQQEEWSEDLNVLLICPDCRIQPPTLVEDFSRGDTICGDCGRILAERLIDTRSEWRTFSNDDQGNDDPSRIGAASDALLHGSQLSTEIAFGDNSTKARDLSRAASKVNFDKANKSLQTAFNAINNLCDSHNISKPTADAARMYYRIADDAKIFKGKSQEAVIASCIFVACRQMGQQRSFREVYNMTNVPKKELGRSFKLLENVEATPPASELVTDLNQLLQRKQVFKAVGPTLEGPDYVKTSATSAENLMPRACAKLGLPTSVQLIAEQCAHIVTEQGVAAGRSPLSIAGACLYLVSHLMGHPKSPRDVGSAVEVSDGTIRTAYKLMYAAQDKIIQQSWLEKGGDRSKIPAA